MAFKIQDSTAWITDDGSYGVGSIITFDESDLTEDQWDILMELNDNDKCAYVEAIMNNEPLEEWED